MNDLRQDWLRLRARLLAFKPMFAIIGTVIGISVFFVYVLRHLKADMHDADAIARSGVYSLVFHRGLRGALLMAPFPIVGAVLDWVFDTGISAP